MVAGVEDLEGRALLGVYEFTFTYSTTLGFDNRFTSVSEDAGAVTINLSLAFPSDAGVNLSYNVNEFGTATPDADFSTSLQQITFDGQSASAVTVTIPVTDDSVEEQDEYLRSPHGAKDYKKGQPFSTG